MLNHFTTANPITRAELDHLRRVEPERVWVRRAGMAVFWLVLAACMVTAVLLGDSRDASYSQMSRVERVISNVSAGSVVMLLIMSIFAQIVLSVRALTTAASSIVREKESRTWDGLLMTQVGAARLVAGKWGAVWLRLWNDFRHFLWVRLGIIPALLLYLVLDEGVSWWIPYVLGMLALMAAVTALHTALGITIGMFASVFGSRAANAAVVARVLHLTMIIGSVFVALPLVVLLPGSFDVWRPFALAFLSPLDGGLIAFTFNSDGDVFLLETVLVVLTYSLGLLVYVFAGAVMFWATVRMLRRQGAL